jgi:hypothetical protein
MAKARTPRASLAVRPLDDCASRGRAVWSARHDESRRYAVRDPVRTIRRRRGLLSLLIAVPIALLGMTAIAGALTTKRAEVSVAPGDTDSASAKCKKGTRAVSGGFDDPSYSVIEAGLLPVSSKRSARRVWRSSGTNHPGATAAATLVDFAYCSDALPKLKTKSAASTTVPNGGLKSLAARCPKGGEAISGGFKAPGEGANQVQVFESRRVGKRTWRVKGSGTSGSESRLNAFAYCAKDELGLRAKVASTSTTQDSVKLSEKARCKKGQQAVSGGFGTKVDRNAGGHPEQYLEPFRSRRVHKRVWKAAAGAFTSGPTVTWDVYVYCMEKDKG